MHGPDFDSILYLGNQTTWLTCRCRLCVNFKLPLGSYPHHKIHNFLLSCLSLFSLLPRVIAAFPVFLSSALSDPRTGSAEPNYGLTGERTMGNTVLGIVVRPCGGLKIKYQ